MNRNKTMDVAKGLAMCAVIIGHMNVGGLGTALYTFHLPLFYIISGFFFTFEPDFLRFTKKKAKGYLIPYFGCAAVIVIAAVGQGFILGRPLDALLEQLKWFGLQMRHSTLWFLSTLFIAMFIFWLIVKISKDRLVFVSILSILTSAIAIVLSEIYKKPLLWNIDTAFVVQIFLCTGYFMKKTDAIARLGKTTLRTWLSVLIGAIVCSGLSVANYFLCGETFEMFFSQFGIFPFTICAAIAGSISVIMLSTKLSKARLLAWIGENSMAYFAFHQFLGIFAAEMLLGLFMDVTTLSTAMYIVYCIAEFIIVMLICTFLHWLLIWIHCGAILGKKRPPVGQRH